MTQAVVERVDGGRFGKVNKAWTGETVAILAGGPSLTPETIARCRGLKCIAVNDQYRFAPWADVLYFADARWWVWHKDKPEFKAFAGIKVSIENAAAQVTDPGVIFLRNGNAMGKHGEGISPDPCAIQTGSNSAFQAANIAALAGAKRILLLGVDGKRGAGGQRHNFGNHPDGSEPPYEAMRAAFTAAAPAFKALGVEVLNCNPDSAVGCFRFATLDEVLCPVPTT